MKKIKTLSLIFLSVLFVFFSTQHSSAVEKPYVHIKETEAITNDLDFRLFKRVDISNFNFPSCQDVPVLISRCIPSACKIKAPFGEIIVQIKQNLASTCEYSEKTIGIGGFDCKIPTTELEEVDKAFQKRYSFLAIQSVELQMSPLEVQTNERIFKSHCTYKKDFTLSSFISIGALQQKDRYIDPEIKKAFENNKAQENIDQIPSIKPSDSKQNAQVNLKSVNLLNFTSVIYTNDELDFITRLVEGLTDTSDVRSSYGSSISKGPGVYTLDSLIFRTPDSWTVWLNGVRYDEKSTNENIQVIGANKNSAIFKWDVPNIDRVSPNWREYLVPVNDSKYASEKSDVVLEVENEKVLVTFRLQPRQTFIAQTMQITDGK